MAKKGKSESKPRIDSAEKQKEKVESLEPPFSKPAIICIGEYPIKILLEGFLSEKKEDPLPLFVDKSSDDIAGWSKSNLDPNSILGLDLDIDTHFWFQVFPHITNEGSLVTRLKNKPIDKLRGAVLVSSLWDGVGSGLLPALISKFKEWNTNTLAFGVLPSKMQVSDVQFNAFSSIGMCVSKDFASLLLLDRDQLENYVGVNRKGCALKGKDFFNYLIEMVLTKETVVQELSELSRAFDTRIYTMLSATGASLSMYGSIKNILDSTLSRPLLKFDLDSASVVYVLLRLPLQLKEKLSKGKIELDIAKWFKEKASLKTAFISEPLYVDDTNDRIDLVVFVGGFNITEHLKAMEKKVTPIKNFLVKKGSIKEDEWRSITKSLGNA